MLLQVAAAGCRLLQVVAAGCRLLLEAADCCRLLLQAAAAGCRLLLQTPDCCRLLLQSAGCCCMLQTAAGWCCRLQQAAADCRLLLPFDFSLFCFKTNGFSMFFGNRKIFWISVILIFFCPGRLQRKYKGFLQIPTGKMDLIFFVPSVLVLS